ncbi:YncE family protein [Streptomyces albus]
MPPRPGNRRSGGRIAAIVIACLLGVALIGGGAVFALSVVSDNSGGGDEPDVPSDALEVAWKSGLPRSTASSGSTVQWPARWLAGSTLVLGDENGVRAYDTGTGRQKWKVKPPEGAGGTRARWRPRPAATGWARCCSTPGATSAPIWRRSTWTRARSRGRRSSPASTAPTFRRCTRAPSTSPSASTRRRASRCSTCAAAPPPTRWPRPASTAATATSSAPSTWWPSPTAVTNWWSSTPSTGGRPTTVSKQQGKPLRILSDHPLTVAATVGEGDSSPPRVLNFAKDGESVKSVDLTGKAADVVFNDKDNGITESGLYFCKLRDGSVAALDLRSGRVLWEGKGGGSAFVGYDSAHRRMLIAEPDPEKSYWSRVGALDPDTGKLEPVGTMVLPDGTYLSGSRALYAYETGKVLAIGERADDGKRLVVAF